MIFQNIVTFLFGLIIKFTDIILTPINLLITNYLPDLESAFDYVSQFFTTLSVYGRFVLSWTGLYSEVISLLVLIWVAIISIPFLALPFKRVISWWKTFKL